MWYNCTGCSSVGVVSWAKVLNPLGCPPNFTIISPLNKERKWSGSLYCTTRIWIPLPPRESSSSLATTKPDRCESSGSFYTADESHRFSTSTADFDLDPDGYMDDPYDLSEMSTISYRQSQMTDLHLWHGLLRPWWYSYSSRAAVLPRWPSAHYCTHRRPIFPNPTISNVPVIPIGHS